MANPVNNDYYQGHGDHWEVFMPINEFIEKLNDIIQKSRVAAKVKTLVSFENNVDTITDIWALLNKTDNFQIATLLGYDKVSNTNNLITTYPIFMDGTEYNVVIDKVEEWNNHIEAIVTGHIGEFYFGFFATDYVDHKDIYTPGVTLKIKLSALAIMSEIAERGFEFTGQEALDFLSKTNTEPTYNVFGEVEPVKFDTTKLVAYLPSFKKCPDEAEFQSPILTLKKEEILNREIYRADIIMHRDENENDDEMTIPLRFKLDGSKNVEIGDPLRGRLWLMGEL